MARAQSQPNPSGDPPRRKRLSLLDSYSAFSDDQLQDAAAKIRRLVDTRRADVRGTTELSTHQNTSVVLTVNQALLYYCLKRLQGAPTSLSRIARAISVSQDTLKSCLQRLREERFIDYGGRVNCGGRFGFTARALQRPVRINSDRNALVKRLRQLDYRAMMLVVVV